MHIKTPSYLDVKRKIEGFKKLSLETLEPDYHNKRLSGIVHGAIQSAISLENEAVYRARWNERGRLFERVSELIYPSAEYVTKKGRFNNINDSIFYGALCELGTIIELRTDLNKFFTISKFKRTFSDSPIFFPIGVKDKDGIKDRFSPNVPLNKTQRTVIDFLNSEVTKEGLSGDTYNTSIAIGKFFLRQSIKMGDEKLIQGGVAYPSIESKRVSNATTYNIAMTPTFFDHHYCIEESFIYVLTNEKSHYQLNPINYGTADEAENIVWKYSFEEMKDRVSKGLLFFGDVCGNIIGLEGLL
jgi:hypothetical protein